MEEADHIKIIPIRTLLNSPLMTGKAVFFSKNSFKMNLTTIRIRLTEAI